MTAICRLSLGATLSLLGAMGMVLAPNLGLTLLGRPWSFLVGFLAGIAAGSGVALTLCGLLNKRRTAAERPRPGYGKEAFDQ